MPITRKADVLRVLQDGGYAVVPTEEAPSPRLSYLFNVAGYEVPAWQTAITSSLGNCMPGPEVVTARGICREWRIRS